MGEREDHELGELLVESELLRAMAGGMSANVYTPTHADVMDEMIRFVVAASIKPTCFLLLDRLMAESIFPEEQINREGRSLMW